jgi:hypothetical protein
VLLQQFLLSPMENSEIFTATFPRRAFSFISNAATE